MAIGGAINFAGCAPDGSNITADTTTGEPEPKNVGPEDEKEGDGGEGGGEGGGEEKK